MNIENIIHLLMSDDPANIELGKRLAIGQGCLKQAGRRAVLNDEYTGSRFRAIFPELWGAYCKEINANAHKWKEWLSKAKTFHDWQRQTFAKLIEESE